MVGALVLAGVFARSSLAQPWTQRTNFVDVDLDGVLDPMSAVNTWDSSTSTETHASVTFFRPADGTTVRRFTAPHPNRLFANDAIAIEDVNSDGVFDLIVSAPLAPGSSRRGELMLLSGATGDVLNTQTGPINRIFAAKVRGIRDINGDGKTDLAVASLFIASGSSLTLTSGSTVMCEWRAYSGATLAPLGSVNPSACPTACIVGSLADVNNDTIIDVDDLSEIVGQIGSAGPSALGTDITGDGETEADDVDAAVEAILTPVPISCVGPLPASVETLVKALSLWNVACESGVLSEKSELWNATASACIVAQNQNGSGCSGGMCVWRGNMSWKYWGAFPFLSGLGSIEGFGTGIDSAGCVYLIDGKGSISLGAGGVLGRVSASINFEGEPAPCQFPFNIGSTTKAGFAGPSGLPAPAGFNLSVAWPYAEMGWWDAWGGWNDTGAIGFFGGASGAQGEVKSIKWFGPYKLVGPIVPGQPCMP